MADAETTTFEDPAQAISQGKRHLLVRDYTMAVTALAQGCAMLANQHGEMADELGEPFLLYGRALLCLSREEAGVLGSGVPGTEEAEEDGEEGEEDGDAEGEEGEGEEGEDEEGEEKESSEKEKDGKEKDGKEKDGKEKDGKEKDGKENDGKEKDGKEKVEKEKDEKVKDEEIKAEEKKDQEDAKEKSEKVVTDAKPEVKKSNDNEKIRTPGQSASSEAAGSSNGHLPNGKASVSGNHTNGVSHSNAEEEDADSVDNEDDDDGNSNLQVAWEVLELSKLILLKRGEAGWKLLAEAHRLLGEVAMESGNQAGALTDLNACLDLLRKIEPADPRSMAETHYQLGLAYSLGNEFDSSIEQFNEATSLLETRIKELQSITEPPKTDDPFYTVEGEIKELRELLPEIRDKIIDMRDFKQQACKLVIEGIKSKVAGGSCSNGAGPSGASSSAASPAACGLADESKPVTNISHLVRKKRKTDEEDAEGASPCKKPTPEKVA